MSTGIAHDVTLRRPSLRRLPRCGARRTNASDACRQGRLRPISEVVSRKRGADRPERDTKTAKSQLNQHQRRVVSASVGRMIAVAAGRLRGELL